MLRTPAGRARDRQLNERAPWETISPRGSLVAVWRSLSPVPGNADLWGKKPDLTGLITKTCQVWDLLSGGRIWAPVLSVVERFRLSAGGAPSAIDELGAPIPDPLPFGPSLFALAGRVSTFGLVLGDDVYQRFTYANHTTQSEPPTASVLAIATSSHNSVAIPGVQPACTELSGEGYTCPQSFAPHCYQ
jgi:hypothetical protein